MAPAPKPQRSWAIILHAGAGRRPKTDSAPTRDVCLHALARGLAVLREGGNAVDAVVETMMELEKSPLCNAGYGSVLNERGEVEMDAAVMDGATFDIGAVGALRGVRHPAQVAHLLLREPSILLVGTGARAFAQARGAELCDERDFHRIQAQVAPSSDLGDTVGCVALDTLGSIAAGTSTGGLSGKPVGRVGDSPLPGCGFHADNAAGGASLSGIGERIARKMLAARITTNLRDGDDAQGAAQRAIGEVAPLGGAAGAIVLDARGGIGWAHDTPSFAVAYAASDLAPAAYVQRSEDRT